MFRNAVVLGLLCALAPAAHAIEIGLADDLSVALRGQPLAVLNGLAPPIPIDPRGRIQARLEPSTGHGDSLAFAPRAPRQDSWGTLPPFGAIPLPVVDPTHTAVIDNLMAAGSVRVLEDPSTALPLAEGLDLGPLSLRAPGLDRYTQ